MINTFAAPRHAVTYYPNPGLVLWGGIVMEQKTEEKKKANMHNMKKPVGTGTKVCLVQVCSLEQNTFLWVQEESREIDKK